MSKIERVRGLEILDSRGRPTVKVICTLEGGATGTASVPSGASTGGAEAVELRDGDSSRFGGYGCRKAVENIQSEIGPATAGQHFRDQGHLDETLIDLDGTSDKSNLGANSTLAVSLAFSRAQAAEQGVPLYRHLSAIQRKGESTFTLPRPIINLFSGGKHAGQQISIQDVLLVPVSATTISEVLETAYAVYHAAARIAEDRYGMRLLTADEGGLAPPFTSAESMMDTAVEAIRSAGFEPGRDVMLALDVASSHFYRDGFYYLEDDPVDGAGMVEQIEAWTRAFPIVSIEDGLAEEDWEHWTKLVARLPEDVEVVGDDLLCTNSERIRRAAASGCANALLLKVNQIGTLTEAAAAYTLAREADWSITVSARSGDTEDDWLADLAVGWGADQIKVGSIMQSERLAKYNRLLELEALTGLSLISLRLSTHAVAFK